MINPALELTLGDGSKAVIRSPNDCDVQGLLDYIYKTACDTEFLLRYPEECSKYTFEGEKAFIERINSSDTEVMLICEIEGIIAATCQISWSKSIKTRHRASIAIAVVKQYWGLGIGSRLMEELIRIARSNENIIQIELDFIEGNFRARALYEKFGFRITGVKPNAIRLKDGTLLNEYSMIKTLER